MDLYLKKTIKREKKKIEYIDTIIVGGGIAGLNIVYQKTNPTQSYALFEKDSQLGGRISTYHSQKYIWEKGAGRFNQNHHRLLSLTKKLHLDKKIQNIGSSVSFYPSSHSSILNSFQNPFFYIQKVYKYYQKHKKNKKEYENKTYIEYAKNILTKEEIQYLLNSFGYESELIMTNAVYAIHLFHKDFSPHNQFMNLKDGMDQLIHQMVNKIKKKKNVSIHTSYELKKIKFDSSLQLYLLTFIHSGKKVYFSCKNLVLALPKYSLQKLSYLKKMNKELEKVHCIPLMRTYAVYPPQKRKNVWFEKYGKVTTNHPLRYIIPIDKKKGVIMISYTDGQYAKKEYKLNELNLKKMIRKGVRRVFGEEIGDPKILKRHYWDCGVALWKKGKYNYHQLSKKMIKPFKNENLFICGENYSMNQGWIEGALETSDLVIKWLNQSSKCHN